MHALRIGLALAAALVTGGPAWSQGSDYDRPGPYLAVGGMVAHFGDGPAEDGTGGGVSGRLGYRLFRHLAVEVASEYTPQNDVVTVIGQLKVPLLTGVIQPNLQGGPGVITSKAQNVGAAGRLGAGVDLYISSLLRPGLLPGDLALYADGAYVFASGQARRADHASFAAGLLWRW